MSWMELYIVELRKQFIRGIIRLSKWRIKLGIHPQRIKPGHPQQNGRHERMHHTLKEATIQTSRTQ